MKQRTFKPGDYCRFTPEEIPTIISLLKANGWEVNKRICFNESHDCIIVNEEGGFHSYKLSKSLEAKNVIQRHDFMVTALRLQKLHVFKDFMNRDNEFHIQGVLHSLGVKNTIHYVDNYTYSDWCKRLNVEPIHIPDFGKILTLPDGTTVDLTKPLESKNKDSLNWMTIFHYIGITSDGEFMVETKNGAIHSFDFIRNKPEPEFKEGDGIFYKKYNDWVYEQYNPSVYYLVKIYPAFIDGKPVYPPFD